MLMKPRQNAQNPHDVFKNKGKWVRFEYEAQRGSLMGMHDYAVRFLLMNDIMREHGESPSLIKAMAYLLDMRGEVEKSEHQSDSGESGAADARGEEGLTKSELRSSVEP